jgi:hypothetical protein
MTWHVLDINSVWVKEFTSALSQIAPTLGWVAEMSWTGLFLNGRGDSGEELLENPPLKFRRFPLQRGYSRAPISWLTRLGPIQVRQMTRVSDHPEQSPLLCSTPFYLPVAEKWPGPVVYYLTDMMKDYGVRKPEVVTRLDRRMCSVATLVCPDSQRIADYLQRDAGCAPSKIVVSPMATRVASVYDALPSGPGPLPADIAHLPRPVVGITGNLERNQDWILMRKVIDQNPGFSWAFVGPTSTEIPNPVQRKAREELMSRGGDVKFTGGKAYGQLREYARSFDVALLPYQPRNEPTYSGSSTRYYLHLAACRPMISTRGFEELLHKEPLVRLVDTAEEVGALLSELRQNNFRDGFEELRWKTSQQETWDKRAAALKKALEDRVAALQSSSPARTQHI